VSIEELLARVPIFAALNNDGYEGKVGLETHLFDGTLITAAHKSMDEIMKICREV